MPSEPLPDDPHPSLAETYWQPFRYTPEADDAMCFSCARWMPPAAFEADERGIPYWQCRACAARASAR